MALRLLASVAAAASAASAASAVAVGSSAVAAAGGSFGVDVSETVTASQAKCMSASYNITFGIARAWYSDGAGFDHASVESVASFRAANMSADVYMFPCSFGLDAASQVTQLLANLSSHGVEFGRIWFDVETNPDPKCAWKSDKKSNCDFMGQLVAAAQKTTAQWGVYSSIHMWTTWMEDASAPNSCAVAAELLLWYPHYQSPPDPSFDDFVPFGGWTAPTIKQYYDGINGPMCGVGVDNNWRP